MKKWSKPEITELDVKFTEAGIRGGASDLVHIGIYGADVIGTSGPTPPEWHVIP